MKRPGAAFIEFPGRAFPRLAEISTARVIRRPLASVPVIRYARMRIGQHRNPISGDGPRDRINKCDEFQGFGAR